MHMVLKCRNIYLVSDQGPMTKETSNKKNWKGKVAKQWKRMHAGSSQAQNTSYPEGGSIGMKTFFEAHNLFLLLLQLF